ncbi:MAG: purine-nucleoside phosphorylase [Ruminococcus sp.]|jgi:purine-nucleoside phosphorylase|nr:purine-nucleoside phosphorylase [Ruminococcus sp.]
MSKEFEKLQKALKSLREKTDFVPRIGLILGSGLGNYADNVDVKAVINYADIEGFPVSTVLGHDGKFIFGYVKDVPVVVMKGRVHYYEGYNLNQVVLPVRLMKLLGCEILFVTNASGSVNTALQAGDFMLITDHICTLESPLIGENIDELGTRFPDMSAAYDKDLRQIIKKTAETHGIPLREGVYIQLRGPNYETPAEVKMCRILGADAVGMSTAVEVIAARHCGLRCVGISVISNLGCGLSDMPLTHAEVQETADRVAPMFTKLVTECIYNIDNNIH